MGPRLRAARMRPCGSRYTTSRSIAACGSPALHALSSVVPPSSDEEGSLPGLWQPLATQQSDRLVATHQLSIAEDIAAFDARVVVQEDVAVLAHVGVAAEGVAAVVFVL